jgi:hypothetical protein
MGWSIGSRKFSRRCQPFGEESRIVGEGDAEFGFDLTEGFDCVGHAVVEFERGMLRFDFSVSRSGWLLWGASRSHKGVRSFCVSPKNVKIPCHLSRTRILYKR